ncbi:MAG: CCXG family PEP-CTERM protein [Candidatus Micrarchaeia archaeon]
MKNLKKYGLIILIIVLIIDWIAGALFFLSITKHTTSTTSTSITSISSTPTSINLTTWKYRRPITIDNTQNPNTLSNYQVLVTLDTASLISAGKMRSDCGDIRFTDSDAQTLLSYWIENGCNSANTRIWVKVPTIPASSTKTIYVYYGNLSATSLSNGDTTFTQPGTLYITKNSTADPNNLNEATNYFNQASQPSGYCTKYILDFSGIANSNSGGCAGSKTNIAYYVEAFFYVDQSGIWQFRYGPDFGRGGGLYVDNTPLDERWTSNLWWGGNWNSSSVLRGSMNLEKGWHKIVVFGFENCCDGSASFQFARPDGTFVSWTTNNLNIKSRKYTSPEPTISVGVEQSI